MPPQCFGENGGREQDPSYTPHPLFPKVCLALSLAEPDYTALEQRYSCIELELLRRIKSKM